MKSPAQHFSLDGRIVLVTGASRGLGRHFAAVLASAGAEVYCAARNRERLREVVAELSAQGAHAHALVMDVKSRASIGAAMDEAGAVDVLVNNAGVSDTRRLLDVTDADWDAIVDTNLRGGWMVAQEAARRMIAANVAGCIVNVTSILASRVAGGVSPYTAAKAGLKALTQSMALELAPFGIRVNSLAPGYVVTDMNREFLAGEGGQRTQRRIPLGRFARPEDLDGPLLLLASAAGAYLTGAELVVDGGHLCSGL